MDDEFFPLYRLTEIFKTVGLNAIPQTGLRKVLIDWCNNSILNKPQNDLDQKRQNACLNF